MTLYNLAVEEMSDSQLTRHLLRISMELRSPAPDFAWVQRRRRIPDELEAIAIELQARGIQPRLC